MLHTTSADTSHAAYIDSHREIELHDINEVIGKVNARYHRPIVYHRGWIGRDINPHFHMLDDDKQKSLRLMAEQLYKMSERGEVFLVQRRIDAFIYEYIAIAAQNAPRRN